MTHPDRRPAPDDEPRWLNDEEQSAWRAFLRTHRLLQNAMDRDLQQRGVQLSEYEILSMLSESAGCGMRMSALAAIVVQSRSRLTHTAGRLEQRGWVQRRPAPSDGRGVELTLTQAGVDAIHELAPVHVASVRRHLIDHLTPEQFLALGEAMAEVRAGILGLRPEDAGEIP